MSDIDRDPDRAPLIRPLTLAVLLVVGIACFAVTLVLGAYLPDLRGGEGGGGHALSQAFNGFAGAVRLAEATGRAPLVVRDPHRLDLDALLVATPESGAVNVGPVIDPRSDRPTLLVLPKWQTVPDPRHAGWSHVVALLPPDDPARTLFPAARLAVVQRRSGGRPLHELAGGRSIGALAAPQPSQAIRPQPAAIDPRQGDGYGRLLPIVVDDRGDIVLGRFADRPLYILADPDLLDNRGLHDPRTAAAMFALLDRVAAGRPLAFDVTLNGFGHGASPLKLLFEPPFVAVTASLVVAAALAALGTWRRFGSPRPRPRAIAFGKAALVDNTALLVRKARREGALGARYADVIREVAARTFAVPPRRRGAALDAALDRIDGGRFTPLAAAAAQASDGRAVLVAADDLYDWMEGRGMNGRGR